MDDRFDAAEGTGSTAAHCFDPALDAMVQYTEAIDPSSIVKVLNSVFD